MAWLNWSKRIKLIVDNTNIDDILSDFPVLIKISNSSGISSTDATSIFTELGSDANRKKIAVTTFDGTTQCYVEIERWDHTNSLAWLWVKIPSVASVSVTELYIYYDASKADNATYVGDTTDAVTYNVWDSNFKLVMHMAQDLPDNSKLLHASEVVGTNMNPSQAPQAFTAVDCTGLTKANGTLKVELKASDPSILTVASFEITSFGTYDFEEWAHTLTTEEKAQLSTEYQVFYFSMSDFVTTGGELDVSQIDYIRWWSSTTGANVVISWRNAEVIWPDIANDQILDSTSNANHGTPTGSMTSADSVDGKIGKAMDFDGNNDSVDSNYTFTEESLTTECIVKSSSLPAVADYTSPLDNDKHGKIAWNHLNADYKGTFNGQYSGSWSKVSFGITSVVNHLYLAGVATASRLAAYRDGELINEDVSPGTPTVNTLDLVVGKIATLENYFPGIIDEIRLSDTDRGSAWIKATYYSNWDGLISFGSEEVESYISGYVKEGTIPVNRQIYLHNRDTGALITSTTSSGAGGYFYCETTYSGAHYVVCLDDEAGVDYNDLIYGNIYPATTFG